MGWRTMAVFGTILFVAVQVAIPGIEVMGSPGPGDMVLVGPGHVVKILIDTNEDRAVHRAARDLAEDICRVSGIRPELVARHPDNAEGLVVVGTVSDSRTIRTLIRSGRLDAGKIPDTPASYLIQTVQWPVKGIEKALVNRRFRPSWCDLWHIYNIRGHWREPLVLVG